jgi:hypothetical protein
MRKLIALALLAALLPTAAVAQNSSPSQGASGKKTKLFALGSVIGGVGLIVLSTTTGKQTSSSTTSGARCFGAATPSSNCNTTFFGFGGTTSPAGSSSGFPTSAIYGIGSRSTGLPSVQGRGTNWKLVGPAIGAIGVGTFALYRSHVSARRADLSIRPSGAVQLSYKW